MRRKLVILVALAALIPTLASAQRGGGGSGGGSRAGGSRGGGASFKIPSRGDLEDLNPASFLIDKRKKIGLNDEQVAALKLVETHIKERYKINLVVYDSLRRNARPMQGSDRGAAPSQAEQDEMRRAMQGLQMALTAVRNQRTADIDEALGALTDPAVKAKAAEILKEQQEDFERLMPGGGRGGDR
jgi:hypothetical protein